MTGRARVSIVGGSGYGGGELLRLLLGHPQVEIAQVTSESHTGEFAHSLHPNLRPTGRRSPDERCSDGLTQSSQPRRSPDGRSPDIRFTSISELQPCDVLFLALPHGEAQKRIDRFAGLAERIVDLSADFRIRDLALYQRYYGEPHAAPAWVERFAYGLPEINREAIRTSRYASGVGCNATASILALLPVVRAGLLLQGPGQRVVVDLKAGSSEGGASPSASSHHPEPKLLAGTNLADVGWELDPKTGRLVALAAIDNLGKGAAGSAVQCMNLMLGWDETLGLEFTGLHPA